MRIVILEEAMNAAATAVYMDKQKADMQFGAGLFDKAVAHHTKLKLRANISLGTTQDKRGVQSKYINYTWGHIYDDAPHFIWYDFFRNAIMNTCSRMAQGLNP